MENLTLFVLLVLLPKAITENHPFPECVKFPSDVIFLLDGSGSVGEQRFTLVKQFVENLVSKMNVAVNATRVGLVQYSGGGKTAFEFKMSDYQDSKSVINKLRKVEYDYGSLQETGEAFKKVGIEVLGGNDMGTSDFTKQRVVVLIAEGPSTYKEKAIREAELLKKGGVHVVTIGVGNRVTYAPFVDELKKIASSDVNVFFANDDELMNLIGSLGQALCPDINALSDGAKNGGEQGIVLTETTHNSVIAYKVVEIFQTHHVTVVHTSTKVITSYLIRPPIITMSSSLLLSPNTTVASSAITETTRAKEKRRKIAAETPQFSGNLQMCYACQYDEEVAKNFQVNCEAEECSARQPLCADAILELNGRRVTKKTCVSETRCNSTGARCVQLFDHDAEFTDCRVECCDGKLCNPYNSASLAGISFILTTVASCLLLLVGVN